MGSRQKFQNNVPGKHDTKTKASSNGQNSCDPCACTIIPLRNVHRDGKRAPLSLLQTNTARPGPSAPGTRLRVLEPRATRRRHFVFPPPEPPRPSFHLLFHMEEDPTCGVGKRRRRRRTRTMYAHPPYADAPPYAFRSARRRAWEETRDYSFLSRRRRRSSGRILA